MSDENVVQVTIVGKDDGATQALQLTRDQIIALANGQKLQEDQTNKNTEANKRNTDSVDENEDAHRRNAGAANDNEEAHRGLGAALHENRTSILAATRAMHGFQRAMGEAGDGTARTASLLIHSFATGGPAALAIGGAGLLVEEFAKSLFNSGEMSEKATKKIQHDKEEEIKKIKEANAEMTKYLHLLDLKEAGVDPHEEEAKTISADIGYEIAQKQDRLNILQDQVAAKNKEIDALKPKLAEAQEKQDTATATELNNKIIAARAKIEELSGTKLDLEKDKDALADTTFGLKEEIKRLEEEKAQADYNADRATQRAFEADEKADKKKEEKDKKKRTAAHKGDLALMEQEAREKAAYERQLEKENFDADADLGSDRKRAEVAKRFHNEELQAQARYDQELLEASHERKRHHNNKAVDMELQAYEERQRRFAEIDKEREAAFQKVQDDEDAKRAAKEEKEAEKAAKRAAKNAEKLAKEQARALAKQEKEFERAGVKVGNAFFHGISSIAKDIKEHKDVGKDIFKTILNIGGDVLQFVPGGQVLGGLLHGLSSQFHTGGMVGPGGSRVTAHTGRYLGQTSSVDALEGEAFLDRGTTANLGGASGVASLIANKGRGIGGSFHAGDTHVHLHGSNLTPRDLEEALKNAAVAKVGIMTQALANLVPNAARR